MKTTKLTAMVAGVALLAMAGTARAQSWLYAPGPYSSAPPIYDPSSSTIPSYSTTYPSFSVPAAPSVPSIGSTYTPPAAVTGPGPVFPPVYWDPSR